jgi:hypothetical protein
MAVDVENMTMPFSPVPSSAKHSSGVPSTVSTVHISRQLFGIFNPALHAVLEEQERQRRQGVCDPHAIAAISHQYSIQEVLDAVDRGEADEADASRIQAKHLAAYRYKDAGPGRPRSRRRVSMF